MSARRISSLFRELAEAFDDLEREQRERRGKRAKRVQPLEPTQVDPEAMERVRRGLRRAGVRT